MKEIIEHHIEKVKKLGYSDEQAEEIIHRVSNMMTAFIDAAWRTHPAQLCQQERTKKSLVTETECVNIETSAKHSKSENEVSPSDKG